jgi:hypothetical protein
MEPNEKAFLADPHPSLMVELQILHHVGSYNPTVLLILPSL